MQTSITIDAQFVRAAQACQASKDVRYYLQGIYLAQDGRIAGTNGHVLFCGEHGAQWQHGAPEKDLIIAIDGNIPASAETVTFYLPGDGETEGLCKTDNKKAFTFSLIDGKYPDIARVIPEKQRAQFSNGIVLNPEYLALLPKVFGKRKDGVALHHGGTYEPALFTLNANATGDAFTDTALFVIMPIKPCSEVEFLQSIAQ